MAWIRDLSRYEPGGGAFLSWRFVRSYEKVSWTAESGLTYGLYVTVGPTSDVDGPSFIDAPLVEAICHDPKKCHDSRPKKNAKI